MRIIAKIFCGLSVFAFTTVACNKEIQSESQDAPVIAKHAVKVVANVDDTKTAMMPSGNQTAWTNDDLTNIHIFENGIAPADPSDLATEIKDGKMLITASFVDTGASEYTYTSILSSYLDSFNASLPEDQFIIDSTFDPTADILVAKPVVADPNDIIDFQMQYKRVVAINKMKIKGLTNGDVIQSVTISSNKPFLGYYNMTNDEWTNSGYELTLSQYEDITVSNGEVSLWFITAPVENATLSIYVVTDNHQYEKDFTKTITFAANTVTSFATTVAGCEVDTTPAFAGYQLVESAPSDWKGTYLLVGVNSGSYYAYKGTGSDWGETSEVNVSSNIIATENSTLELEIVDGTTSGTYAIKSGSNYLSASAAKKFNLTATYNANNCDFSISIDGGVLTILQASSENRQIRYNYNGGSGGFRWYNGTTANAPFLYAKNMVVKRNIATPVFTTQVNSETLNGIIVIWTDVTRADNYTVSCTGEADQTIASGVQRAEFNNLAPGIYSVTVRANPADATTYNAATAAAQNVEILDYQLVAPEMSFTPSTNSIIVTWPAVDNASSYTYTVLDSGNNVVVAETNTENLTFTASGLSENTTYTFKIKSIGEAPYISSEYRIQTQKTSKGAITTIAGIKTEIANNVTELEATLTNAVVTRKFSDAIAYLQDNTAGILVTSASGLSEGDSYTGTITGTMGISNSQPKITAIDVSAAQKSTGASKTPVEVTIATLNSNMSDYDGMLCKIVKAKAGANLATGNNKSITISQGSNSLTFFTRASFDANTVVKDSYYDVIGFPCLYTNNNEIVVVSTSDVSSSAITWQLKSIGVATQPTKLTYTEGEYFDPTGLVLSTVLEDAADETIYKNGDNVSYADHSADFTFNPTLSTALTTQNSSVTVYYGGKEVSQAITVNAQGCDVLNRVLTGVSGTSYSDWSNKSGASGAKYAGNSAGGNDAIQLRSSNNNSGIVSTTSGGYFTKVVVTWESNTQSGRKLNVYGKNTAYSAATDLYGENAGDLIGTIVCGTSTELTIPYDYQYIGLRSDDGAMYLTQVQVYWSDTPTGNNPPIPTYSVNIANNIQNGTVVANKSTDLEAGDEVTLTITPSANYALSTLTVDGANVTSQVSNGTYTFDMPAHDVSVSATFSSTQTGYTAVPNQTITFSSLYATNTTLDGETINGTNCSLLFNKRSGGTATQYYTNGTSVRWYGGGTLAITAASGYKITSIKINYTRTDNAISADVGTLEAGVWSGEIANGSSVTFTEGGTSGHLRISSIEIN